MNNFIFLVSNYSLFLSNYNINKWNKFYRLWDFSWALDYYNKSLNNISLHNIWNVNYYLWEDLSDEEKINYYNKSLEAFSWALNIKFDDDTKFNYDYLVDLLKDLEDSQDEQNQEENQEQQDSWENSEEQESSNTWEEEQNSSQENEQNQEKSEQESSNWEWEEDSDETEKSSSSNNNENNWEWEENSVTQMSNWEYQQVKKYIESLEQQEWEYQDFFNKTSDNTDPFESMFDSMFNNWGEKDW